MHSPLSIQAAAHLRDASGPSPVRTMSRMPLMMLVELESETPAGCTLGQTSTHLPHLVQASSISLTRASRAVSKVMSVISCRSSLFAEGEQTARKLDLDVRNLAHAQRCVNGQKSGASGL